MNRLFTALFVLGLAQAAFAVQTDTYGWEESFTVLGISGNGVATLEYTSPVHGGSQSLEFIETPLGGTPQAYTCWVKDLSDGDTVAASFYVYDDTPSASPSGRIWAHWNDDPVDPTVNSGSAGGNDEYSAGTGWSLLSWEWTVSDGHVGLMIEARIYSSTEFDTIWIDDMTVEVPDGATIVWPNIPVALQRQTWAEIKATF
ncbi:MAG: hypothetical protein JXA64_08830 [Candidatus Fermentibacteraceae bacterium]|nr:hypothetical protein [Candidatus Fermentibacteraceae bacterium]MBN2609206.1 hypothetical protein [Candidatus Fermentibacteraceae bacterium]